MPINWPDRYDPARADTHVVNRIEIAAPPQTVWTWLTRAAGWPDWYPNSSSVRIEGGGEGGGGELSPGARFRWRTFGVGIRSQVQEFEPFERMAWDGQGFLLDVYHAWLIEPRGDGCRVLTEETQNGLAARLQAAVMPGRMNRGHQVWLERLKEKAEGQKLPARSRSDPP